MGFCFFTENTTLNIHSLGLNVGQLVHCICIGGGGGGVAWRSSTTANANNYGGGGGGGAGGYFIGEQRIYNKAGFSASATALVGGASGYSLDYVTLYPSVPAGQNGRSYPVLNKAGSGVCILMW